MQNERPVPKNIGRALIKTPPNQNVLVIANERYQFPLDSDLCASSIVCKPEAKLPNGSSEEGGPILGLILQILGNMGNKIEAYWPKCRDCEKFKGIVDEVKEKHNLPSAKVVDVFSTSEIGGSHRARLYNKVLRDKYAIRDNLQ